MKNLSKYWKTIVAVIGAGVVALQAAVTDGITPQEWLTIAITVLTAAGVFAKKNNA